MKRIVQIASKRRQEIAREVSKASDAELWQFHRRVTALHLAAGFTIYEKILCVDIHIITYSHSGKSLKHYTAHAGGQCVSSHNNQDDAIDELCYKIRDSGINLPHNNF